MALSKVDPNSFDVNSIGQYGGRRNLAINGAMQVAQRATSATGINTSQYTSVDRFEFSVGATFATFTTSQSTDAPNGFSYSAKFDCTTANASPSAGAYLRIRQKIEGQNLQGLAFGTSDAKDLSVSFWIKSNQTGNMVVNLRNFNSSQQRISNKIVSIDSANTWEYKTFTISGDTVRSIDNNNGEEFNLEFWFNAGASYTASNANSEAWIDQPGNNYYSGGTLSIGSSTDDYVNITGVQMEAGSTATPFEHRSYGEELALCQRYFQWVSQYFEYSIGTTGSFGSSRVSFTTPMRANPTYTVTGSGGSGSVSLNGFSTKNVNGFPIGYGLGFSSTSSGYIYFDATASADAEL